MHCWTAVGSLGGGAEPLALPRVPAAGRTCSQHPPTPDPTPPRPPARPHGPYPHRWSATSTSPASSCTCWRTRCPSATSGWPPPPRSWPPWPSTSPPAGPSGAKTAITAAVAAAVRLSSGCQTEQKWRLCRPHPPTLPSSCRPALPALRCPAPPCRPMPAGANPYFQLTEEEAMELTKARPGPGRRACGRLRLLGRARGGVPEGRRATACGRARRLRRSRGSLLARLTRRRRRRRTRERGRRQPV